MGSEKRRKRVTGLQVFATIAVLMVSAVIAGGLYLAGSPSKVRAQNFDNQRLNELQQISSTIDYFVEMNRVVPNTLQDLQNSGASPYYVNSFNDPETKQPYEYRTTGNATYELCATFALPTTKNAPNGYPLPQVPMAVPKLRGAIAHPDWTHSAGYHCFSLDASSRLPVEPSRK